MHPVQLPASPSKPRVTKSDSEEKRNSGAGILEFTPARAGMDVTPLNLVFKESPASSPKLSHSNRLSKMTFIYSFKFSNNKLDTHLSFCFPVLVAKLIDISLNCYICLFNILMQATDCVVG